MAEDLERDRKTEPASEQRLRQAREEGRVAVGHDAVLVAGLAATVLTLSTLGDRLRGGFAHLLGDAAGSVHHADFSRLPGLIAGPAALVMAVCAVAAVASFAATLAQTRGGFWPHLAAPDFDRMIQTKRLTRLLSSEFLVDLGIAVLKVGTLATVVVLSVREEFLALPRLTGARPGDQLAATFRLLTLGAKPVLAAAIALAAVDLAVQHLRFGARMRMTKEELKREVKEEEGDPLVRGQRKRRHRELARGQARIEVPRADALVVNPTHVAVAIRYRRDEGRAPRVVAKGKGALAEFMRELARENAVPIVEDIPLARLLHRKVKVGREIPAQTYKAVAAILAFVYRVTGRSRDGSAGAGAAPAGARP